MMRSLHSFFVCFSILLTFSDFVIAATYRTAKYTLVKDYGAGTSSFWENFDFYTGLDPTNGNVVFLNESAATDEWMVYNSGGTSWFGPNYYTYEADRESVRLQSKASYNNVLIIVEFDYVPGSVCGSWPAFWTANIDDWPYGGEIDILEGVNNQQFNHYAFHTGDTCHQSGQTQTGIIETTDCNVWDNSNSGCGGWAISNDTYGDGMIAAGGGVYAMDWRNAGIRIWYFSPDAIPKDIIHGHPTTSGWGKPMADLPHKSCHIANNFYNHHIIFDITFCGDWAGADYPNSGCPGTCVDYVQNNPYDYWYSYFGVTSLKVYKSITPL